MHRFSNGFDLIGSGEVRSPVFRFLGQNSNVSFEVPKKKIILFFRFLGQNSNVSFEVPRKKTYFFRFLIKFLMCE